MKIVIALFAGLAIGAAIGILVAPKSGKETRDDLMEQGEKLIEKGKESVSGMVDKTKDLAQSGKKKIEELIASVK